ncbi:hypothetical protein C8N24_0325 [Solirubrobacter pauli]|uniref:Uncharacterized protein n=1 Tax=Solirubrobacter pauli TaxID=166793 RepID=A0A660L9A9_9ACTN|nr:hypothetical protein [Solirubrobacter pauli]RKQ90520.1 hypothetical protein C8N24_0325 [Solirubrobacter pauli]
MVQYNAASYAHLGIQFDMTYLDFALTGPLLALARAFCSTQFRERSASQDFTSPRKQIKEFALRL